MKNWKKINKKGFTLAEVVTAVGILVIIVVFTSIIFKSSIDAYRIAGANAEIIQKLQTITTQLDRDFSQVRKDGWLEIRVKQEQKLRSVTVSDAKNGINKVPSVWMDRIYYFTTGDFQAYSYPQIRNNVARIYFGPDMNSIFNNNLALDKCRLARDVLIFTPESSTLDDMLGAPFTYSSFAANPADVNVLIDSVDASIASNINNARRVFTDNVGYLKIEWLIKDNVIGVFRPDMTINWLPGSGNDRRTWMPASNWPKALKFTFTLYDSKEIIKGGRIFTHIVYLD